CGCGRRSDPLGRWTRRRGRGPRPGICRGGPTHQEAHPRSASAWRPRAAYPPAEGGAPDVAPELDPPELEPGVADAETRTALASVFFGSMVRAVVAAAFASESLPPSRSILAMLTQVPASCGLMRTTDII